MRLARQITRGHTYKRLYMYLGLTAKATTPVWRPRRGLRSSDGGTTATTVATATSMATASAAAAMVLMAATAATQRWRHRPSRARMDAQHPGNEGCARVRPTCSGCAPKLVVAVAHLGAPSLPQRARRHLRPIRATAGESVLALKRVPCTQNARRANTRFQRSIDAQTVRQRRKGNGTRKNAIRTIEPFAVEPAEA